MSLFSQSNVMKYVLMIGLVLTASLFSNKWKTWFSSDGDEYELIRKYLLNDNPLYGFNKPKLWIHTTYAYNARQWQSFGSRSSCDLNQPYIHLTVRTLIHHCGGDFNICLIDDDSFAQLLPKWTTQLDQIPEPQRAFHRQLALVQLLYTYGGFLVPNTFACVKNLLPLYKEGNGIAKIVEMVNPYVTRSKQTFVPNPRFLAAKKGDSTILALAEYLKTLCNNPLQGGTDFGGAVSDWCLAAVKQHKLTLIDGIYVGAKTSRGKAVALEDLMQQRDLDNALLYGVVVPADAILSRPKYQWFAALTADDVLAAECAVSKLLRKGLLDEVSE
jgi:hypothetical protein